MVPRLQRKAASKKSATKAKKASTRAQQKKATKKATRKAANKPAKKAAKKAASPPAPKAAPKAATRSAPATRKTAKPEGDGAKRVPKPISKPPKLEMNSDVMEFIAAIDAYRQEYHRPFPGWSEILFVVKNLGYKKKDN